MNSRHSVFTRAIAIVMRLTNERPNTRQSHGPFNLTTRTILESSYEAFY